MPNVCLHFALTPSQQFFHHVRKSSWLNQPALSKSGSTLLKKTMMISRVRNTISFFILETGDPSIYTMDHPDFIVHYVTYVALWKIRLV